MNRHPLRVVRDPLSARAQSARPEAIRAAQARYGVFASAAFLRGWEQVLTTVLALGIVVLLGVHSVSHRRWVDMDGEYNLPAMFSALLFALAGAAAARSARRVNRPWSAAWPWWLLACAMGFAAVDEVVGIHEYLTVLARRATGLDYLRNAWMMVYVPILGVGTYVLRPWWHALRRDHPVSAMGFALGLACWFVAYVVELAQRLWGLVPPESLRMAVGAEESFEMLGAWLWLYAGLLIPRQAAPSDQQRDRGR